MDYHTVIKRGRLVPTKPTDTVVCPTCGKTPVAGAGRGVTIQNVMINCALGTTTTINTPDPTD